MQRTVYQNKINALIICLVFFLFVFPKAIFAQTGSVEGIVRDKSTNETLIGASVAIDGTNIGVSTDADGRFKLLNLKTKILNKLSLKKF